jgi:hypothetical protein
MYFVPVIAVSHLSLKRFRVFSCAAKRQILLKGVGMAPSAAAVIAYYRLCTPV